MLEKDFVTLQGHNCILGNVYNIINYYHINITEADLFFWFCPFDGDKNLYEVFEKLYEDKDECNWKEYVIKSLKDGQPVMISVNPKVLPYIKVEVGDPSLKHYINIIGIDENRKQLYVSDSYVPTYIPSTYEGWVDYSGMSDSDIGNCWRLKSKILFYLQNDCRKADIKNYTRTLIIKRLSEFLKDTNNKNYSGIEELHTLSGIVKKNIEDENYGEIFKLLAGIRLNIINPLIYLVDWFEHYSEDYDEWIERLNNHVKGYWEAINVKLLKFALAHKKLEAEKIFLQIEETVALEQKVLNDLLERLLEQRDLVFQGNEKEKEYIWNRI